MAEEGKKTGPDMAEMGLEYGFKGQAGMGKGGYNSRFRDKRAWVCVCVCVHTGEALVVRYTLQSTFPELGEPGQLHISGQPRDRGADKTPSDGWMDPARFLVVSLLCWEGE